MYLPIFNNGKAMQRIYFLLLCCILSVSISYGQTASFTYQTSNGLFCNPATINFTQTCTGNPIGFTWNFGNGQFSNSPNPSIVFAAGTYTVKLVAVFNNVAKETSQTIVVNPSISVSVTADRNYICQPGTINFTASSTGNIATYEWDFGDGGTAITSSPVTSYTYSRFGSYTATVKATDVSGCNATNSYVVTVQRPPITGTVNPVNGCIPAPVTFAANTTLPAGSSVTNYNWDFGDGNTLPNGTTNSTAHTYTATGSYVPTLTITTVEGCTNTFTFPTVAFGTPPTGLVAFPSKTVYCGSETPLFTATATNANSYLWDFGDGNTATVTSTTTSHKYTTLGTKTVTVTPYFNGCAAAPASFTIDIVGVIAGFTYSNTCSDKKTFLFINTTQGNQSTITWDFGDGSPTVSTTNVTHTYPAAGAFVTSLFVTDNITGCTDRYAVTIYTANISLTNPDVAICRNSNTTFTIENNYSNTSATYEWNVVGLPPITNNSNPFTVTASVLGNFNHQFATVNNGPQYCIDTVYLNHAILVRGPNLSYTAPTPVCANEPYNITNTSGPFLAIDTVKLWYWNYGQGPANDTIYQPPTLHYPVAGNYNIKLVAKDNKGCIDSLTKSVIINPVPFLRIIPRDDTLCLGQTDSLIAYHSGTILWSPASMLSCSTCDTTIAAPTTSTTFYAVATNVEGCTAKDSTILKVYTPFTAQPVQSPVLICQGDGIHINVTPPDKIITWSPATNISDTTIYNPLVNPASTTRYTATLTDSAGCFNNSAFVDVIVKTLPIVNAGPDQIVPYNSSFTISPTYSNNIVQYVWAPAGTLNCITCPSPSGIATASQLYSITVTSDSGCVAKDEINIFVECKYANLLMAGAFSPNRDGRNDYYFPMARGIKLITKFIIFDRYGQKVFEAKSFKPNDKAFGWNGRYRGQENSPGTYVYLLEAICETGETLQKNGSFILVK